jgi:hypothetical protein
MARSATAVTGAAGLAVRAGHDGVRDGGVLDRVVDQAAARHSGERDPDTFEQIRRTLRLAGG